MLYRKLDANKDYTFGMQAGNFYKNTPQAIGQAVETRLGLIQGEWFLDITAGTPYNSRILGAGTVSQYDRAIQEVILQTQGVTGLVSYTSSVDPTTRAASVECTIDTIYGQTTVNATI